MNFVEEYFLDLIIALSPIKNYEQLKTFSLISHYWYVKLQNIRNKHKAKCSLIKECFYTLKYNFNPKFAIKNSPMYKACSLQKNNQYYCYICCRLAFDPVITSMKDGYMGYLGDQPSLLLVTTCYDCAQFYVSGGLKNIKIRKLSFYFDIDSNDKFCGTFTPKNYNNIINRHK